MEFPWPLSAIYVVESRKRCIRRYDSYGHLRVVHCHPLLDAEHLKNSSFHDVVRRVNPPHLICICERRRCYSYRKGKIDALFVICIVFGDVKPNFDPPLAIQEKDFGLDAVVSSFFALSLKLRKVVG